MFEEAVVVEHRDKEIVSFPINAPFSFSMDDVGPYIVKVANNTILRLDTVTHDYKPFVENQSVSSLYPETLMFSSQENPESLALCHVQPLNSILGLSFDIIGPRTVILRKKISTHNKQVIASTLNLFGLCMNFEGRFDRSYTSKSTKRKLNNSTDQIQTNINNKDGENGDNRGSIANDLTLKTIGHMKPDETLKNSSCSKKARKKLAKQKQIELEATLANKRQKEEEIIEPYSDTKEFTKKKPLSDRRMSGGIVVKDIIIGGGPIVKVGRRIAILYEGKLADGTVFDKKQNRKSPLEFRHGTGQVIKGLERGLEGMRAGGERTIIIPPSLGYGAKGAGGTIPGNATLTFNIYLISVGGSS